VNCVHCHHNVYSIKRMVAFAQKLAKKSPFSARRESCDP